MAHFMLSGRRCRAQPTGVRSELRSFPGDDSMTTVPIVGGLGTTALNRIDDPFSDCVATRGLEDTLDRRSPFPVRQDDPWLSVEPAPVQSRPSRAIAIPVPPCVLDEPLAEPSRASVSQRIFISAMSTIILAAAITAVREHASELRISNRVHGASTLLASQSDATLTSEGLVPRALETRRPTSAIGVAGAATKNVPVEQRKAQVPALRLPDVVLSARSRARLSRNEHERARARTQHRAQLVPSHRKAALTAIQAPPAPRASSSPVFDDAVPPNPYAPSVAR